MNERPGRIVLVTGAGGQVGRALCGILPGAGWQVRALPRPELDITDAGAVRRAVRDVAAVVNLAAYTAVDRAEAEPEAADRVNRVGAGQVALAAAAAGVPLIHLSTDFVFGGTVPGEDRRPFRETDPPAPLNVYGASKLAGEGAVLAACPQAVILRCAWIFSAHGRNFVRTIRQLGTERGRLRVVADQYGSPTAADDVAAAILAVLALPAQTLPAQTLPAQTLPARAGIYHFAGVPAASWYDLAVAALAGTGCRVEPIATKDWPTAARRPDWSVLDSGRFATVFGLAPPHWCRGLAPVVAALADGETGSGRVRAEGEGNG